MEDLNADAGLIEQNQASQSVIATKSSPNILQKQHKTNNIKQQIAEQMQKLREQKLRLIEQREEVQRKKQMALENSTSK